MTGHLPSPGFYKPQLGIILLRVYQTVLVVLRK